MSESKSSRRRDRGEEEEARPARSARSRKVKVMGESEQTDGQRRELRKNFRALQRTIQETSVGEEMEDPESQTFDTVRDQNNELFDQVRYTREAVLDADNTLIISEHARKQVEKLVQVPKYDAGRLISKLRQKCNTKTGGDSSSAHFDWLRLGVEAGACYNTVPSRVSFLAGPLHAEYKPKERKVRQARVRQEEDTAEEERPEDVKNDKQSNDGDRLSAVETHIKVINNTLRRKSKDTKNSLVARHSEEISEATDTDSRKKLKKRHEAHGGEISVIPLLFNPKSFTQTVENIFHFSFQVKSGHASISARTPEQAARYGGAPAGPVTQPCVAPNVAIDARQAIVSLNMRDWRKLCEAYNVESCDVPHRTGSKHARSTTVGSKFSTPQSDR
uniref:Non-structural maintenance of chromosomes element 4 n=1 Tax=Attheya septentrionalis TaxID=420275 RepID=A0A7S2XRN1_9STRA|mmetsp:Transcript_3441/g.6285  ORF Transcript_3441/g.6285 Transcript_3441/m.6285 type:complete len:389 (+) Transcript_3441:226-1392(+)